MLKFIFGLPSSGKTTRVLNLVKEHIDRNESVILIVPEQFSFQTERSILHLLGDFNARKVEVLSFTRLYDQISDTVGGICGKLLGDSDKIILMNRVLSSLKDELIVWGRYTNSLNFSKSVLDTIGELKVNAITSDDIRKAANATSRIGLKNKLYDIALIYENFDALLGEKYIDPVDKLTKVYRDLEKVKFFENKTVFFDSFKAFTGQQFKIIDRILTQADNVYFAINNDTENALDFDVYSNLRKNIDKIKTIAKKHHLNFETDEILKNSYYTKKKLISLERLMAGVKINDDLNDTITVCACDTPFDEAEFAARNIRRIIRESNGKYRFKDFVIIARDTEKYQQAVERACLKNEISCFFDKRIGLNSLPFSFAVDAAIKALDLSTENILRFHKCGFTQLTVNEISKLENYTFLWGINGKSWQDNWEMDPRGFVTDEADEEVVNELNEINRLRNLAIEPILRFKNNFYGSAMQMASAIVKLLDDCNAKKVLLNLSKRFENNGHEITPDVLKQGFDRFMAVLDSIVNCFGDKSLSKTEFCEALTLALSIETVGVIPQFLDEVSFGSADRIQPARPKFAFILGANQGVFPKTISSNSLLTVHERKLLNNCDIDISDNSITDSIEEEYLVYSNVTCADEKLFISYTKSNFKGEELQPSPFVSSIINNLNPLITSEPLQEICQLNMPETNSAAFSEYCRRFNNQKDMLTLSESFIDDKKFADVGEILTTDINCIKPETANKLYGNTLYLSATKFDTVNRCKFSYFCKYGLKAEKLQAVDFNVLQRGLIAHHVLENIIENYKTKITTLTHDELCELTDFYIEDYLNKINGFNQIRNAKSDFILSRISRSLKEVVCHIVDDFKQSKFEPVSCEFPIGYDGGVDLKFDYDSGKIVINGSIDRVDKWGDYIRIVDYKTGTKTFKLPDVLYGLNMQMLIYLYAVIRGQGLPDDNAAAILYMPAKRDVKDEGLAMNGLIKGDIDLHAGMENKNEGKFVPKISIVEEKPKNKKQNTIPQRRIKKNLSSFTEENGFTEIFDYIEKMMRKTGNSIASGDISVSPLDGRESEACKYCDFKNVCNIENRTVDKVPSLKNSDVFEKMREAGVNGI